MGLLITSSVIYALYKESAAFLLPYLLLMTFGFAAVCVLLLALVYTIAEGELHTIRDYLSFHGLAIPTDTKALRYMGWTLVGSCIALLALQIWLISIVFACWRYFR
ncbi:Protein C30F12.3 [Aphelenchoides avenae]|nr:Protein C30F12.3 [Aphelenchus avenae]